MYFICTWDIEGMHFEGPFDSADIAFDILDDNAMEFNRGSVAVIGPLPTVERPAKVASA